MFNIERTELGLWIIPKEVTKRKSVKRVKAARVVNPELPLMLSK